MILIIDNFDSFTYNIFQFLSELTEEDIQVYRNNALSLSDLRALAPSRIILSPGPGRPEHAGICTELVQNFAGSIPILGVCLGHQVIAQVYGARIVEAPHILHGKTERILHDGKGIFRSIPQDSICTRYHSLIVEPASFSEELELSAWTEHNEIMGLRHSVHVLEGVQFHPESIASEAGMRMLRNFLEYRREPFTPSLLLRQGMAGEEGDMQQLRLFTEELTEGRLSPVHIASIVASLGSYPSSSALTAMAEILKKKALAFPWKGDLLDTCGTGGDGKGTHNISSLTALLASACGVPVAKHGNSAVSSRSGSADLYRELGISFQLSPDAASTLLERSNFVFLFAPLYHGGMRHAATIRKELGVKTIFNLLGPLVNPASATSQLIGVFDKKLLRPMAEAAHELGVKRVLVVHGDGFDEVSVSAPSDACYVDERGDFQELRIDPREHDIAFHAVDALAGGSPKENAEVARAFIAGAGPAALRDAVLLNTAAALFVAGMHKDISEAIAHVRATYARGILQKHFDAICKESHALSSSSS